MYLWLMYLHKTIMYFNLLKKIKYLIKNELILFI